MKIYFIKIALRGVTPMVWRRLRIPGVTSLPMLHEAIQIINGWDDDYLHQFHIHGKDYGVYYDGGRNFSDDASAVHLDDFHFDVGDKFTYEYNFFAHHLHDIRIEDIKCGQASTLTCLSGSGMPGASKYDVVDIQLDMVKKIIDQKGRLSSEDIEDYREKINLVKFNKHLINERLTSLIE